MSYDEIFDYSSLKLIEKPDSPKNAQNLPETLEGCQGYLTTLPLKSPNADRKIPQTIANMVNILTDPDIEARFDEEEGKMIASGQEMGQVGDGSPSPVYNYRSSSRMKAALHAANNRTCHVKTFFGHVVLPGCLSFYAVDGKTYAVSQGRWSLLSYKARWIAKNVTLDRNKIQVSNSPVLIIRVNQGSIGRVRNQGNEVLLDAGTHVFNSGLVADDGTVSFSAHEFHHGRYHFIRVLKGAYGKVWAEVLTPDGIKSVQPRLLREGDHCIDSYLFKFDGFVSVKETCIIHGSVARVNVDKGFVAKIWQDNSPRLLGEGSHLINSTKLAYDGMVNVIKNACIVHGTITILRVTLGNVALAWKDNNPTFFFEPGLHEFDSQDFEFVEMRNAEEPLIQLGAKKIILVHTGQVAVTYDQGQLKILNDGRHIIDSSTHIFHRFLSTQQKSIRLTTYGASHKRGSIKKNNAEARKSEDASWDSDMTVCETKDLVRVGMRADVFYSIDNPAKCIQKIDTDKLEDLVRETAVAALTNIVRSTALNEIAQSKNVSANSEESHLSIFQPPAPSTEENPPPSAPMAAFFEKIHDEFLAKLHTEFINKYGVDIASIRIMSFKIMDDELAEQISRHALTTAQIENQMANLEGKSLISVTEERTAAEVKAINIQADAAARKTTADAENQRKIDAAKATAEAQKVEVLAKAEAQAEAVLMKAKADAEAIRLKAKAEAERAELLSLTNLGQQEALLDKYSEMVIQSNKGVSKVVYLDPSVNRDSPFALGSLNNLNMDLHSLSKIGIAARQGASGNGRN